MARELHPRERGEKLAERFLKDLTNAELEDVFAFIDWSRYSLHITRLCMSEFFNRKLGPWGKTSLPDNNAKHMPQVRHKNAKTKRKTRAST